MLAPTTAIALCCGIFGALFVECYGRLAPFRQKLGLRFKKKFKISTTGKSADIKLLEEIREAICDQSK